MSFRCFIAVELEAAVREGLRRLQQQLQGKLDVSRSALKWVRPENIHLTLKFLGEVDDGQLPSICEAATRAASEFEPFAIEVGDCGCFPPQGSARVLWVGICQGAEALERLQRGLDEQLDVVGFAPEGRKFTPHLTLARINLAQAGYAVREIVEGMAAPRLGEQEVAEIKVFQSELSKSGPTYTVLHHAVLGEK